MLGGLPRILLNVPVLSLFFRRSTLRKIHDNIADPKYDGVRVSRKQLLEDDEPSSDPGPGSGEEEEQEEEQAEEDQEAEEKEGSSNESLSEIEENEDDARKVAPDDPSKEVLTLAGALRKTQVEDRKKGLAFSRQIVYTFTLRMDFSLQIF